MARFRLIFLLSLTGLMPLLTDAARAGGCSSSGCGGNFSATEFQDLASDAISDLRRAGPVALPMRDVSGDQPKDITLSVDPALLEASFKTVSVVDGQLYLDGKMVSFKSDPASQHVDFNEKDWKEHPERAERLRMVIHELLMLASRQRPELDDYRYLEQLSRALTNIALQREKLADAIKDCPEYDPNSSLEKNLGALGKVVSAAQDQAKKPGVFCIMITYAPGIRNAIRYLDKGAEQIFTEEADSKEQALAVIKKSCAAYYAQNLEACDDLAIRCDRPMARRQRCQMTVPGAAKGYPSRMFDGYDISPLRAEFAARMRCLSQKASGCLNSERFGQETKFSCSEPTWEVGAP